MKTMRQIQSYKERERERNEISKVGKTISRESLLSNHFKKDEGKMMIETRTPTRTRKKQLKAILYF